MKDKKEEKTASKKDANGNGNRNGGVIGRIKSHPYISELVLLIVIATIVGGFLVWQDLDSRVYIEKAEINAPIIILNTPTPGILDRIKVAEGDYVGPGHAVAYVNDNPLETKTGGIIIAVKNTPGQFVTSQDAIVKMFDPAEFRVIGRVEEDKGLSDIKSGQKVIFTVDAFSSREYEGVVDSIAPSARQSDIVFSISDRREVREFEVKARFDVQKYPELKNGMSAKMWVYK